MNQKFEEQKKLLDYNNTVILSIKNENILLKDEIKTKDNIINGDKRNINKLNETIKDLQNKIFESEEEIKKYKSFFLNQGEKLISVKFISVDQIINTTVVAKNTDIFARLEEKLYNKYPNYKDTENYFVANGDIINRNRTLEENKIKNNDVITLMLIEDYE